MQRVEVGCRIKITGFILPEESQIDSSYLGCKGIVTETDGVMHHVYLDEYQQDGPLCFLSEEIDVIIPNFDLTEGGEVKQVYIPITPQYVLGLGTLSVYEKLCYFLIHHENPATVEDICKCLGTTEKFTEVIVKKLEEHNLIMRSKTHGNTYFCNYQLQPNKKKEEKEEKTVITEEDKDILLMIQAVERYYHKKGVNHKISKNGKKHLAKAVYFLDGMWKKKKIMPEMDEFEMKDDFYTTYVEYVFNNVPASNLNQLKRLTYTGSKRGFKYWLTKPTYRFDPHLIEKKFDDKLFYGLKKKEIPKDIKTSGYWSTYKIFLGARWQDKTYPVARQVLYALEMVIIFMLFRKQDVGNINSGHLIAIHHRYIQEYKRNEAAGKLDNLTDFVTKNKMNSNLCNDCVKKRECVTYKTSAIVVNCSRKQVING